MELLVLVLFFVLLAVAGMVGWVSDSRDYADWTPTDAGFRVRRGY
jgi:hypothetical protein